MRFPLPLPMLVALVVAGVASAVQAADTEHLRYERPVDIAPRAAEELVAVRLDAEILAATADGYPDLRVLDGEGREVSRVLRKASVVRMGEKRTSFVVDAPRLEPLPGGGLEIDFTIDPEKHPHPIDGFRIDTPLRNFEQSVQVHRLDDSGTWRPVGDDTLLYDYSQFMDTRQVDVPFPRDPRQAAGGTWRITVDETTIEQRSTLSELVRTLEGGGETGRAETTLVARQPFRIDAIQAWRSDGVAEIKGAEGVEFPVDLVSVEQEPKEQRTRVRVATRREPVTALRLVVGDRNFGRTARVERPHSAPSGRDGAGRPPQILASARVHRVDLRGINQEELRLRIPESRFPDYEIVIDNGDSQPLDITGVTAVGPAEEVVFLARPGEEYRLAYGGVTDADRPFPRPRYDTAAIDAALAAGQVPLAGTPGPVEEREVTAVEVPWAARLVNNRWLVGATIAILAVLLMLSLASAARRIDAPGDRSENG